MDADTYTTFEVGDLVRPIASMTITERFYVTKYDVGRVTELTASDNHSVVTFLIGTNEGKMATMQNTELVLIERGYRPQPEGGFAQAATEHLSGVLTEGTVSTATRSVMVSGVFVQLEIARQIGRVADALDKIGGALLERDL